MYDVGSIPLVPHILLSSRKLVRKAGPEGSRPSRTYDSLSGVREGNLATHLVQILNKPHQIVALKVRDTFLILLLMKYAADLIVKPGRGPVEATESL